MADNPFNISLTGLDNATLFEIYCVSPPSDSCPFGPCPNPDVTGFGQQVSLYITATVFAITLVHNTANFRAAWFGYIANVYSLLVATSLSIARGQLTKRDAVFVLVAVSSPATFHLWFLSATQVIQRSGPSLPSRMAKWERTMLLLSSGCLFLFWIALFPVIFVPFSGIEFSQTACNQENISELIFELLWAPLLVNNWAFPLLGLIWLHRPNVRWHYMQLGPDVLCIQWCHKSIKKAFNHHGHILSTHPNFVLFLTLMNQLMAYALLSPYASWVIDFTVLACGLYFIVKNVMRCHLSPGITDVLLFLSFLGLLAATPWTLAPTTSFITLTLWGVIFWDLSSESQRLQKYVSRILFLGLCTVPGFILYTFGGFPFNPNFPEGNTTVSVAIAFIVIVVISCYGPSTSVPENLMRIWFGTIHSSPAFKSVTLVIGPTLAWISSTLLANPTKLSGSSFGQIFALMTSIASLSSLIVEIHMHRQEVVANFWFVEEVQSTSDKLPTTAPQAFPPPSKWWRGSSGDHLGFTPLPSGGNEVPLRVFQSPPSF